MEKQQPSCSDSTMSGYVALGVVFGSVIRSGERPGLDSMETGDLVGAEVV
jgi:hypothetical protein